MNKTFTETVLRLYLKLKLLIMKTNKATVIYEINGKRYEVDIDTQFVPAEKEAKHIAMESLAKNAIKEDMRMNGITGDPKVVDIVQDK